MDPPEVLSEARLGQEEERTYKEADCKQGVEDQAGPYPSVRERVQASQGDGRYGLKKISAGHTLVMLALWS